MATHAEAIRPTVFNSATGTAAAKNRPRHRNKSDLTQIVQMQAVLHAIVTADGVEPKDASACARAWSDLRTRKRELLGQPLPGVIKHEGKPKRKQKESVSFTPAPQETGPILPPVVEPDPIQPV